MANVKKSRAASHSSKWPSGRQPRATPAKVHPEKPVTPNLTKLRRQDALLRALIGSPTDIMVFSLDRNYCYATFNARHHREMKKLYGADIRVGTNALKVIDRPAERAKLQQAFDRIQAGGSYTSVDVDSETGNWYESSWNPIRAADGTFEGLTAFVQDITRRKRVEAALAESELNYRRLFESSNDAIMLLTADQFLDCNPATLRVFGCSTRDEFLGKHLADVSPPRQANGRDSREAANEKIATAFRVGRNYFEWLHQRADGTVFPADVLLTPMDFRGQEVLQATVRDISGRRQADAALSESEERFRRAFEDSGVGKLLTGLDGRLLRVNRAFAVMLGHTVEELQSLKFANVTHPDDVASTVEVMTRLQTGSEAGARLEKRCLHKSGGVVWVDLSAVLLRDATGRPDHFVADVVNITDRKLAEAELAQKNAELVELNNVKNKLLGMAAHDLRNPLSIVSTASTFLLDDASRRLTEVERFEFLRRINSGSRYMFKLIDDLQEVAKIEAGRLELELRDGDLCGLIEENLALNRVLAENKRIRLEFAPGPGLPPLRFDRHKVGQVINRLLRNALKLSAPGTAVTVQASSADGSVVVSVRVQRQGIPTAELGKLFEKASARSAAGESSTAFGLAICREIVEGHGGRIWAESGLGKGSVFSFSLPVAVPDQGRKVPL